MFIEGEIAILNENAKSGLPMRIGERVMIEDALLNNSNYDYRVSFDSGDFAKVKASELNKLSKSDEKYMDYIYTWNKVAYRGSEAIIVKVDYINHQAEIEFESGSTLISNFDMLQELEDDTVPVIDFDKLIIDFDNEQPTARTQSHRNVIEEIHTTFKIKNADYGNSFGEQYDEHGLLSAIIRLDDKMRRLKQLNKQEAQVKDESIRDTVLDLANYAIMTVMELDKVK